MKKQLSAAILLGLLALIFSACSGGEPTQSSVSSYSSSENMSSASSSISSSNSDVGNGISESTSSAGSNATDQTSNISQNTVSSSIATPTQQSSSTSPTRPSQSSGSQQSKTSSTSQSAASSQVTSTVSFDIGYWVQFAKDYGVSIGLTLDNSAVGSWDNPLTATANSKYLERDIKGMLDWYKNDYGFSSFWVWSEQVSQGNYRIYIGYA